jgi:hypothetical protein
MSCVVTADQPLPYADLPAHTIYYDAGDLRLDQRAAHALAERIGASLTDELIRRAVALTDGRAAVLEGLFVASAQGEVDLLHHAIARAFTIDDMLARLAHVWVTIYAKRLSTGEREPISEVTGIALPSGAVILNAKGAELPEGVYRLEAAVSLDSSTAATASQPDISAFLEGSLLYLY